MVQIVCVLLVLAVAVVFGQSVRHEFVNFDDNEYVYDNPYINQGFTIAGLERAFVRADCSNWHPLTWISHMADCEVYKSWAGGHHLTNVAIHAAVAVLLFLTLRRMTGSRWRSALVAALFAIHPLRVESVAWVAERKDVLSGLFFLLTLNAYLGYVRNGRTWTRYLLVVFACALGLMSKPMLVTLPLVLLLLDYWPLGRRSGPTRVPMRELIVEKTPLLAMSLLVGFLTIAVQKPAEMAASEITFRMRVANAVVSYAAYLFQFFWPLRLAAYYPHPKATLEPMAVLAAAVLLVAVSWLVVAQRGRRPYLLAGWLWYLIMLLPVIGLLQVGLQARADRYTYLPLIGPCWAMVWVAAEIAGKRRSSRAVFSLGVSAVLAILTALAWRQSAIWRDSMSLWTHALDVGCESADAHHNIACLLEDAGKFDAAGEHYQEAIQLSPELAAPHIGFGHLLVGRGRIDEGIEQYRLALRLSPRDTLAETNFGLTLVAQGDLEGAAAHFRKAIEFEPENDAAYYNLGKVYLSQGRLDDAAAAFQRALELCPTKAEAANNLANIRRSTNRTEEALALYRQAIQANANYAEARYNLGLLLADLGRSAEAAEQFHKVLGIDPKNAAAHNALGSLLLERGSIADAISQFRSALEIAPNFDLPHANLGRALSRKGANAAAVAEYRLFLRSQPNHPYVLGCLAWALATAPEDSVRNGPEAVELAQKAALLDKNQVPRDLDILAATYAETGRFNEAVETARRANEAALKTKDQTLIDGIAERLKLYEGGKPYRDKAIAE